MALLHVPLPVVGDAAMLSVFRSAMDSRILLYYVLVDAACDSITVVLLVAAADMVPKWSSNFSMKYAGAPAIWLPGVPAVVGSEISWTRAEECAEQKALMWPVSSLDSCSRALWRRRK